MLYGKIAFIFIMLVKEELPKQVLYTPTSNQEASEMYRQLKVGIIGDYDPSRISHIPTNQALGHAAEALSVSVDSSWLPTESLANGFDGTILKQFDALWCAPGTPYKSMDGALQAIQFARETGWPFVGT